MSIDSPPILTCEAVGRATLERLVANYGLVCHWVPEGAEIPGSYWGAPEAGLIGNSLYLRADTPMHSALHESCHYVCMDPERRAALHTDAGGDFAEEDEEFFCDEVHTTYLHELGHYLGLDEDELTERGLD